VFSRSRLNLANNTHGLGLHSRTLECMAVGGFIFTHASAADDKPGGMHTTFTPDVHYGVYTPDTIAETARRWLRDEARREKAAAEARAIVRQSHTWRRRAEQILADLRS
jgi:glycosyltransferase involved in cell wall biosynthesis